MKRTRFTPEKLKEYRRKKGLSLRALSRMIEDERGIILSVNCISQLENNRVSTRINFVLLVCDALDISISDLLTEEKTEDTKK